MVIAVALYGVSLVVFLISPIFNSYFFKNTYKYESIIFNTANPVYEDETNEFLKDVHSRIRLSELYDPTTNYSVYYANTTRTDLLYFKLREVLRPINMFHFLKSTTAGEDANLITFGFGGYVLPIDPSGTSYIREFSVNTTAHEIAHQMVNKHINNPILSLSTALFNRNFNEGYANLISYGNEECYISDPPGNYTMVTKEVLHNGVLHNHHVTTFEFDKKSFNPYSYTNMLIVKDLLSTRDISKLVRGVSKGLFEEVAYSHFVSQGYTKADDVDSVYGIWSSDRCLE